MLHCLLHVKETMQTWGICTLDSSSHFESHCKEEINNCPLAILDVLQFLTYFTGQMPASTYASLKTNLIIKMTECQQSVSLPTRILKVPSVAPVIIWGTAIGSWCVTPPDARYKSGSSFASSRTTWTPSASTEGPQSQQDEGSAVQSYPWSACCQSRGCSERHLSGTRGIWTWSKLGQKSWHVSMWVSLSKSSSVNH